MKHRMISLALAVAIFTSTGILTNFGALQTKAESNSDAIALSKTISPQADENGAYTIALEAYTTGVVSMEQTANPVDIVLVLDQSGSMICDFEGNETTVQEDMIQYALKNAAAHFVDTVHENATKYGLTHRIAIVTFHSSTDTLAEFTNVKKNSGYNKIQDAIAGLSYDLEYQTFTHSAMNHAASLFQLDPYQGTEERDKIIVMFSDGQPTMTEYADMALETAYHLKTNEGVEIYTIGTFAGADASVISGAQTASKGEKWIAADENADPTIANRFMNYLSSNSSDAQDLGLRFTTKESGTQCKIAQEYQWENKGYYSTANDYAALDQMFDNVSHSVMVDVPSLDATGQLIDFLSPYFSFPNDFTSDAITVQTAACTGVDASGTYQWAAPIAVSAEHGITAQYHPDTKSITVTGFDYAQNVVTETSKSDTASDFGQKLIVTFVVQAKDGFLGGNEVVSNTGDSGIYTAQGDPLAFFDLPYTDVAISTIPIMAVDQSTYLGNAVNTNDAVTLASNPFDGVNNAYVNAEIAIYWDENANGMIEEAERTPIETVQIPAGSVVDALFLRQQLTPKANAHYLVEGSLAPIYGGLQQARTAVAADFSVYLLVPSVSVQDVWVDYGVTVSLMEDCVQEVHWQYVEDVPTDAPTPVTQPPTVSLVFASAIEENIYLATSEKTFPVQSLQWQSTDGHATPTAFELTSGTQPNFTVHLNLCNLTLTKTVDATMLSLYPQTFFFTVEQGTQSFCISMTAQELASGICSKSILGLYAGQNIHIAEDGMWAWRYATDTLPTTVVHQNFETDGVTPLIATAPVPVGEKTCSVKNTLSQPYWLGAEQSIVNRFDKEGDCA